MRALWILTTIGSVACASSGSSPGELRSPTERIVAQDNENVIRTTVASNPKVTIAASATRVLATLKQAFEDVGIPATSVDPSTNQVSSGDFYRSRKLGNERISVYLECGNSVTGIIADEYRVYMTVVSQVRAAGPDAAELQTAFTAYARNIDGTSSQRVACGTTGQLEERIHQSILRRLAANK